METIVMSLVAVFSGVGLFVFGVYIGVQISIKKFLDKIDEKEIVRAIKKRDAATFIPKMSDQEARESDDNSIEKINKTVA